MSYKEAMEYVEDLQRYGSVPGLFNIKNLCEKLGNPQDDLTFVHIAGTNGKGSVLAFLSTILKEAGYRTGRYVSPTVFDYRERIQVNGKMISQKGLCRELTLIKELCAELTKEGKPHPTSFEIETAMAFRYFKEQGCDIVVLETGLGGTLDATNIIKNTAVAVFTSISPDHMGVLGNTLEEIAENKAGILKPGALAVTVRQQPRVQEVLEKEALLKGITLITAEPEQASAVKSTLKKQKFSYDGRKALTITLAGRYQIDNAVLAIEAVKALEKKGFPVPEDALYKGLEETRWPGRFQVLTKKPFFIADGAHNRDGAKRLAQTLRFYFTKGRIIYIIGILRDKEVEEIIRETEALADQILTVSTPGARGLSAYELACEVRKYHECVTSVDSVEEAVELTSLMADRSTVVVAFGSLSYLGEFISIVENSGKSRRDSHGK